MVGLLGVMAAGAAVGASEASNANVEAEREAMRDKYTRQYDDLKYERKRTDDQADYDQKLTDSRADAETKNKFLAGESELERSSKREIEQSKSGGGSGDGIYSGKMNSPDGKIVQDLYNTGQIANFKEGFDLLDRRWASNQVANDQMSVGLSSDETEKKILELIDFRQTRRDSDDGGSSYGTWNPDTNNLDLSEGGAPPANKGKQPAPTQPNKQSPKVKPEARKEITITVSPADTKKASQAANNTVGDTALEQDPSKDSRRFNNTGGLLESSSSSTIKVDINGSVANIPLDVPALSNNEKRILETGGTPTQAMLTKAVAYAKQRLASNDKKFESKIYE